MSKVLRRMFPPMLRHFLIIALLFWLACSFMLLESNPLEWPTAMRAFYMFGTVMATIWMTTPYIGYDRD